MGDAGWIYRKNTVMQKVMELMGALQGQLAAHALTGAFPFPGNCGQETGKISRGEKYRELPWVILDYPRYFSRDNIFAFRTMFWWGHAFSGTLHLAGGIKEQYHAALAQALPLLQAHRFQAYVHDDPWRHELDNGNYRPVAGLGRQEWEALVYGREFMKLAKPYALDKWEKIIPEVVTDYALLLQLLMAGR